MPRYDAKRIEAKWQAYWDERGTFVTANDPPAGSKGKLYVLDMFPYPSGSGLHVGHPEGQTATDIVCRYQRMKGMHVLHPMGWDAFGLPAEQYAIETGTHPRVTTYANIETFRRQEKMLGFSYDWTRELSTTDEDYYRWTQWIFLQLYDTWYDPDCEWTGPDGVKRKGKGRPISELPIPEDVVEQIARTCPSPLGGEGGGRPGEGVERSSDAPVPHPSPLPQGEREYDDAVRRYQDVQRLAYQSEAPVNWCPALGTVLANEEVNSEGRSERGNHPIERRNLRQWMLRITAYAERLLSELDPLDWSESIKLLQRNWIGKSVGAEVDFIVEGPVSSVQCESEPAALDTQHSTLDFSQWKDQRAASGYPARPEQNVLRVYTTRPDTLFGATYMVVAPEHPIVDRITTDEHRAAVAKYRETASRKSDLDRTDLAKEKTGVFTGAYAVNPAGGERIPIWIADYVLISYGTGAIMAVPAHDERDLEFAQTFGLPVIEVVQPPEAHGLQPVGFAGEGTAINSGKYDGLSTPEFKQKITDDLAAGGLARRATNYRLRDWLFSRQRYWGEPFPIRHELDANGKPTGLTRAVPVDELPVTLPEMEDFKPKGTPDPPLSWAPEEWLYATAPDGTRLMRETNSMPQWAGSCWYYLRFCDNKNSERFIDPAVESYWLPVDLYVGGAEHAVLHLLYSRFWHKVLFDRGYVSSPEPFQKLVNQGMILGEPRHSVYERVDAQQNPTGEFVQPEEALAERRKADKELADFGEPGSILIDEETNRTAGVFVLREVPDTEVFTKGGKHYWRSNGIDYETTAHAEKMSKSRGNVINPDDVVSQYGADSLRMYEMFMGPLEQVKPWSMSGVEGVFRFLGRAWRMIVDERADDVTLHSAVQDVAMTAEQERVLHKTIKTVTEDIEKLSLNTAISRMMEFTNAFTQSDMRPQAAMEPFVLLLSPFAPHIAEELWQVLGHGDTLAYHAWPEHDESKLAESEVEVPVQVNGKLRAKIMVPVGADAQAMQEIAETSDDVQKQLAGKQVVKVVAVPGRMVNFVVKG